MAKAFGDAMLKLSLLGQDKRKMIDCSEVIPQAKPLKPNPRFPAGLTVKDLDRTVGPPLLIDTCVNLTHTSYFQCKKPFPSLPSDPSLTSVAPV